MACFANVQYTKRFAVVASGGTRLSKFAIFRIEWNGRVGGASDAVVAVFNIHYAEAKKGQAQGYNNMKNNWNAFFRDISVAIIKWQARIAMGNGAMACYAVEEAFAAHKLTANLLAFHAEYVQEKDFAWLDVKDPRALKWDTCGIWSFGPFAQREIGAIKMQGPAKHCLAAAIWPQRDDDLASASSPMGFAPRCYKRVTPTWAMLGLDWWPHLTEEIFATCMRW